MKRDLASTFVSPSIPDDPLRGPTVHFLSQLDDKLATVSSLAISSHLKLNLSYFKSVFTIIKTISVCQIKYKSFKPSSRRHEVVERKQMKRIFYLNFFAKFTSSFKSRAMFFSFDVKYFSLFGFFFRGSLMKRNIFLFRKQTHSNSEKASRALENFFSGEVVHFISLFICL
jgi:hypothetical protein